MHNLYNGAWSLHPSSDLVTQAHDLASLFETRIIITPNSHHMRCDQAQGIFSTTPRVCTHLLCLWWGWNKEHHQWAGLDPLGTFPQLLTSITQGRLCGRNGGDLAGQE